MKGELKKRCYDYRPTICVCAPKEDEDGNITQRHYKSRREATREEIKQAIDDARKEFPEPPFELIPNPEKWNNWIEEVLVWYEKWLAKDND